jgi:hypothetical protein
MIITSYSSTLTYQLSAHFLFNLPLSQSKKVLTVVFIVLSSKGDLPMVEYAV